MTGETHITKAHPRANLPVLDYRGAIIRERHEMLSLTDMWKAAGSPTDRRPDDWKKDSANRAFLDHVAMIVNAPVEGIWKGRRGAGGGTWAHWQIALPYAKYLDHDFHMWCNTAVRERMEGRSAQAITGEIAGLIERTDGICRMMIGKVTGIEKALPVMTTQIVAELLPAMISAAMASQTIAVRRGRTAGQLLQDHGYRVKRLSCWFSHKLRELGLEIDGGGKGELGLSTAHLFDPDKVGVWMRNGGRTIVDRKVSERQGQGKLRLI